MLAPPSRCCRPTATPITRSPPPTAARSRTTRRWTSTAASSPWAPTPSWARRWATAHLLDGEAARLGKDPLFQSQHVLVPTRGLALFINAFNFPSLGLVGKGRAGPAVGRARDRQARHRHRLADPAHGARTWSTPACCPPGALSVICGSSAGLMDAVAALRRGVVHRLGRHRRGDPLAPAVAQRFGARQHRGRQRQLGAPARARRRQRSLRLAGEGSGARDDGESRARSAPPSAASSCPKPVRRGAASHQRAPGQDHGGQPAQRSRAHGRAGQPRAAGAACARAWPS
jgi:hypothetical protein